MRFNLMCLIKTISLVYKYQPNQLVPFPYPLVSSMQTLMFVNFLSQIQTHTKLRSAKLHLKLFSPTADVGPPLSLS